MYLAMVLIGIVIIIIGIMLPYLHEKKEAAFQSIPLDNQKESQREPDTFSMELLQQQIQLINKRIDVIADKLLEREEIIKTDTSPNDTIISTDIGTPIEASDNIEEHEELKPTENEQNNKGFTDINSVIYDMYDKGADLDEISSVLRIGRGELQLRLGLRSSLKK